MSNKVFNTRIQNKHGTEANWAQAINFTPLLGELIVYDVDENHSTQRIKIGDGVSNVNALPFVNTSVLKGKDNGIPTGLQNLVIQELSSKEIYEDLKAAGDLDENTIYLTPDDGAGSGIIIQNEEPTDAENGTVWIDMDEDGDGSGSAQIPTDYVSFREQALTDGNKAQARNNIDAASKEEVLLKTGGDMTGWINFGQETRGICWTTDNNTGFSVRPYSLGNLFQITRTEPNGNEYGALNIHYDGMVDIQGINNNAERLHNIIVVDAGTDINTLSISPGTIVMVRK